MINKVAYKFQNVLLLVSLLLFNNAYAIKPCDPNFSLSHFVNMADHVIIAKVKDNLPRDESSHYDKKGGETLITIEQQIKGQISTSEILINRFLGHNDLGVPQDIAFSENREQPYLFFVHANPYEQASFGLVYCSPVLEVNEQRVIFKDEQYTIEELTGMVKR